MAPLTSHASSVEPAFNPFARQTPDNSTGTRDYRLRDPPYLIQGSRNQPTESPTDRFNLRRRENAARRRERQVEQSETESEGAGRRQFETLREEAQRWRRLIRATAAGNELEEGGIDEDEQSSSDHGVPDTEKGEPGEDDVDAPRSLNVDDSQTNMNWLEQQSERAEIPNDTGDRSRDRPDDRWSEEQVRGPDPDRGSHESDRPRPGFGPHLPRDVGNLTDDPDNVMPTIEEGRHPLVALQAQRDAFARSERRLRSIAVKAKAKTKRLKETVRQLNDELSGLNDEVHDIFDERNDLRAEKKNRNDNSKLPNFYSITYSIGGKDDRRLQTNSCEVATLIQHQGQLIDNCEEQDTLLERSQQHIQEQDQQIQDLGQRIQDRDQQIRDLTARLNAAPQQQPAARQRPQAPPPRRRLARTCKTKMKSYREPRR
ncbi:MAG: hypothetical protein Q9170_003443 [Blastenia crenularia]